MHRLVIALLFASSVAHAEVDLAGGVASMSASLDADPAYGQDTGPTLAFDGGARVAPWLSVLGFATLAVYRNSDAVDGMRRVVTVAAGPAARLHWRNAFLGIGGGIALWHSSFDDYGAPSGWFPGVTGRLELGFTSEIASARWRAMVAARLSGSWFPNAPADSADSTSGSMTTLEVVAGVAF